MFRNLKERFVNKILKIFKKKMRQDIRLYIGGMEVEFQSTPEIFYNYTIDDLTNPTVVRNSYSKQFTIEGTQQNNKIFGQFWNMERLQRYGTSNTGVEFNPSRKVPFQLFLNGEIYESGYVKLENVRKKDNAIYYDIQLYGGLGELFYILSYDDTGNKLSLADLTYRGDSGGTNEFDFTINKETIMDAWFNHTPYADYTSLWHYINFIPAYEGYPSDFDASKCLVNFSGATLPETSVSVSGVSYGVPADGFGMGYLPAEMEQWETMDLRSYLQRPVLRMKEVVNACVKYAGQYGYDIDLDETFFDSQNPYWDKTWITLPRLNEISIEGTSESGRTTLALGTTGITYTYNGWTNTTYTIDTTPDIPVRTDTIEAEFDFCVSARPYSSQYMVGNIENDNLYTSAFIGGYRNFGGLALQLLAYDGVNFNTANVIGGSDILLLTSKVGSDYLKLDEVPYVPFFNAQYSNNFGWFIPTGSYKYKWSDKVRMTMSVPAGTKAIGLNVQTLANGYRGDFYISTSIASRIPTGSSINTVELRHIKNEVIANGTADAVSNNKNAGFTGAKLTKRLLLSTEGTPADYLLSFCKLFGLYFLKESNSKKVHIMTRDTFYQTGNTVDLEELIDRGNDTNISPIAFDMKWYDFKYENVGGEFYEKYLNTYGREYGIQRVNTGYDFNADNKNLLDGNIFKSAVQGTQKSQYMMCPINMLPTGNMPTYALQGFSYDLYNSGGTATTIKVDASPFNKEPLGDVLYYDAFSKVQFEDDERKGVDGKNVLVLFNGNMNTSNSGGTNINYFITDDLEAMSSLNDGKPCWIYTQGEYSKTGNRIAYMTSTLPRFGRYIINYGSGYITRSMDFGEPKELYIPNATTRPESTIYYSYWKNFISDMYDINTRVLECYVVLKDKPNPVWLRRFYWFDNSIWRLNKITDWNAAGFNTTKMEFVKVQDRQNYTLDPVTEYSDLKLILDRYEIGASGGTINGNVVVPDGGSWYMEYSSEMTVVPDNGTGDANFVITVPSYSGNTNRNFYIAVMQEAGVSKQITQYGLGLSIGGSPRLFGVSGGTGTITINANPGVEWTITMDATVQGVHYDDWLILSQYSGTGSTTITATAPLNPSGFTRQEYIYLIHNGVMYGNITMAQKGNDIYFNAVPNEIALESPATSVTIDIETNASAWTVGWYGMITGSSLSDSTTYSAGTYQHTVQLEENDTANVMHSTILYYAGTTGLETVYITQNPPRQAVSVTPTTIIFDQSGGTANISITDTTRNGWEVIPTSSWLTASDYEGVGHKIVQIYATENNTGSIKSSIVVVSDKVLGGSTTISVQQGS